MNIRELCANVAEQTGVDRNMMEVISSKLFKTIVAAAADGEKLTIAEFGTFSVKERKSRWGRNPQNGEPLYIPESKALTFKPAKAVKDALNS